MVDNNRSYSRPKWLQEIDRYLPVYPLFYLYGNIDDLYCYYRNDSYRLCSVVDLLSQVYLDNGYDLIITYDIADGFSVLSQSEKAQAHEISELREFEHINMLFQNELLRAVLILPYGSVMIGNAANLSEKDRVRIAQMEMLARAAYKNESPFHSIVILCHSSDNFPSWFYFNHPLIRPINLKYPHFEERIFLINCIFDKFYQAETLDLSLGLQCVEALTLMTEGFTNRDIVNLQQLSCHARISVAEPSELINYLQFGYDVSPWKYSLPKFVTSAYETLTDNIKGQNDAILTVIDIIKRAMTNMNGVHLSDNGNKAKAFMFFAGPTGVGKTELANSLSRLLFEDDRHCFRFNMSQYQHIGASNELFGSRRADGPVIQTIRDNPCCVLLFEGIEKAHHSVLDRFINILESGFVHDFKGMLVHFTEAIVIFTMNVGSSKENIGDNTFDFKESGFMPKFSIVKQLVYRVIDNYFKFKLKKPELFNLFGDNIVIFDFIRPSILQDIINTMLKRIQIKIAYRSHINVAFHPDIVETILEHASLNIENGVRGVAQTVEKMLVNPLSRDIFDNNRQKGSNLSVMSIVSQKQEYGINHKLVIKTGNLIENESDNLMLDL